MARKSENKGKENFEFGFKIFEEILTQRFNVNGTGFTPRDVNELNKKELLWENYTSAKWRKFNFVEFIWLKLLYELTSFGIKKKIIAQLRESLLESITIGMYKQMIAFSGDNFDLNDFEFSEEEKKDFNDFLTEGNEEEIMVGFTLLLLLLVSIINEKQSVFIIIDNKGNVFPYSESKLPEIMQNQEVKEFYNEIAYNDHFTLNLTNKVHDFAKSKFEIDLPAKLHILSDDENEVLKLIRSKKLKSLKINFDENEISLIEATEEYPLNPETRFIDYIIKGGYQSVTFTTVKGKIVKFENTIKIKPQRKV